MQLPPLAAAMYGTWWNFANYAANAVDGEGNYLYNVTDASSAASSINKDIYGGQGGYNPIGLSQLFSVARKIGNSSLAISNAAPGSPVTDSMVTTAPWSKRSDAEMAAAPQWQVRVNFDYTDSEGQSIQGDTTVIIINQVLPSSVDSLNMQIQLRVQDQLSSPPGSGTPRQGTLDSVNSITIMAVLRGRDRALRQASRENPHPRMRHIRRYGNQSGPA